MTQTDSNRWAAASLLVVIATILPGIAPAQVSAAPTAAAPWRTQLMPWETHAGQRRPWRADPRLTARAADGYPDDFQVFFANPDSTRGGKHELMWVKTIAYDPQSDLFLGILLNEPEFIASLLPGENVVFGIDSAQGYLAAVGSPRYSDAGWPSATAPEFFATLREGIRAYRLGNNGHNMPSIERCIAVLSPVVNAIPAGASREERFVAHYVLGRCLAEKYETTQAIAQFKAAIALEPNDVDSYLALLAEYSVMTHHRPGELSPVEEKRWEDAFVEHLALTRARFGGHPDVVEVLNLIFDPTHEAQLDSTWLAQVAKLRRVGYAIFRWKQR